MLSWLWTLMILISLIFGYARGAMAAVSGAGMEGASQAVKLVITMAGPLCLWSGLGELTRRSGLRDRLGSLLSPVLGRLFPQLSGNRDGFSALSANVTANLLGLGNAATPMGIEACQAMSDGSGTVTREQCRLIVMNTASIQLLPTTVAALRSSLGCGTPMDILPCVLLSSLCSVTAGLLACGLGEHFIKHDH